VLITNCDPTSRLKDPKILDRTRIIMVDGAGD
jgi:hypothetical protein